MRKNTRPFADKAAIHARGRGAISNESGRYEALRRDVFDDGWDIDEDIPPLRTELSFETSRSVITRNHSPDIPFDRSLNPYRGCEHGCVYCFARPTHAYLGFSAGLDFETKLVVKSNAAEVLRTQLSNPKYRPAPLAIGSNTDPYQPIERRQGVMRAVLEVLLEARHPVTIVTKGALIARDAELLGEMAQMGLARAAISITTLDHKLARVMEPRASAPKRRLWAMERLAALGVPMGVMAAPLIPGLNDHEVDAIYSRASEAGACFGAYVALRLPLEVAPLFREWLQERFPNRFRKVMRYVREMHGGRDYDPQWGRRMRGEGVYARMMAMRVQAARRRNGLDHTLPPLRTDLFRRPSGGQLSLDL